MRNRAFLLSLVSFVIVGIGILGAILLVRSQQDLRQQATQQVSYSLQGANLVVNYTGFPEALIDINVHYVDGTSENIHQQFSEPLGTTTKVFPLKSVCVTWIQVHGTNDHYYATCTSTTLPTTTPTATPVPTATPTPVPTATPRPTVTPTATPRPTVTATPRPTATPTATPRPTATPTATPRPTSTPTPTATPRPTATPIPTATPPLLAQVVPTPTPTPTATPYVPAEVTPTPTPGGSVNNLAATTPEASSVPSTQSTTAMVAENEDQLPKAGTTFPTMMILMLGLLFLILSTFALLSG